MRLTGSLHSPSYNTSYSPSAQPLAGLLSCTTPYSFPRFAQPLTQSNTYHSTSCELIWLPRSLSLGLLLTTLPLAGPLATITSCGPHWLPQPLAGPIDYNTTSCWPHLLPQLLPGPIGYHTTSCEHHWLPHNFLRASLVIILFLAGPIDYQNILLVPLSTAQSLEGPIDYHQSLAGSIGTVVTLLTIYR